MFGWLKNLFRNSQPQAPSAPQPQMVRGWVRGRYDAAATSDENSRHWVNADTLDARAANDPEVRRTLRMRSRYEIANNSYAKGMLLTLANDCIGTGPRLQMLLDDTEANDRIENSFADWAKRVKLAQKLRTMRLAKAGDGETFGRFTTNRRLLHPVQLDLRLIECDQVDTPLRNMLEPQDGVEFDRDGNPKFYHVLKQHPGDTQWLNWSLDFDRVRADKIIHLFREDRPGQVRGVPEITPALPLFAQLRRYSLAVIGAAEAAADVAGVIKSTGPGVETSTQVKPMEEIEMEQRMWLTMPAGWDIQQLRAEQPATTYEMFKREILNEIARCLNMPYNVAASNSSQYNYASGRLDHQTYFKAIRVERSYFEVECLDRILAEWFREASLIEGFLPQTLRTNDAMLPPHQWYWDGFEHVDPLKEANAAVTLLSAGLLTPQDYFARAGKDWEEEQHNAAEAFGMSITEYREALLRKILEFQPIEETEDAEQGAAA